MAAETTERSPEDDLWEICRYFPALAYLWSLSWSQSITSDHGLSKHLSSHLGVFPAGRRVSDWKVIFHLSLAITRPKLFSLIYLAVYFIVSVIKSYSPLLGLLVWTCISLQTLFFSLCIYESETLSLKILISPFITVSGNIILSRMSKRIFVFCFPYIELFQIFDLLGNEAQLDYCSAYVI